MTWKYHPEFGTWCTNFPRGWLATLRFERTYGAILGALEARRSAEQAIESAAAVVHAQREALDRSTLKKLRKAVRTLESIKLDATGWPEDLSRALRAREESLAGWRSALDAAWAAFGPELEEKRRLLWEYAARDDFRHALFELSPDFLANIEKHLPSGAQAPRDSETKRKERKLFSYLTRFCTKSAVCGTSGVTAKSSVADNTDPLSVREASPLRRAFLSHECAQDLANAWKRDPEILRRFPIRLHPAVRCEAGALRVADWFAHPGMPAAAAAPVSADLARHVTAAEAILPADAPWEEAARLVESRHLWSGLDVPLGEWDPIAYWRAHGAAGLPGAFTGALDRLEHARRSFEAEELAERRSALAQGEALFTAITGQGSRKNAGQYYADRYLFFLDARGPQEFAFDRAAYESSALPGLSLAVELLAPEWFWEVLRRYYPIARHAREPGATLDSVARAYAASIGNPETAAFAQEPVFAAWMAEIRGLIRARESLFEGWDAGARRAALDPKKVASYRDALQGALRRNRSFPMPLFASCAIFQSMGASDWVFDSAILGNAMNAMIVNALTLDLDMQRRWTRDALARMLDAPQESLFEATVLHAQPNKFTPWILPIAEVPYLGRTRRGAFSGSSSEGRPSLPGFLRSSRKGTCSLGDHTPRVTYGNWTLQRETWETAADDWAARDDVEGAFDQFYAAVADHRARGWPEEIFVESPPHVKNVFVDFRCFFSVELLIAEAKKGERLKVSEALPRLDAADANAGLDRVVSWTGFLFFDPSPTK